jgi:hypothetical protein
MNQVKVARDHYHRMSPNLLNTFSLGVSNNVYVLNPSRWTTPPMTQSDFEDIIEDFELKRSAFVNGGNDQKGPYTTALTLLMTTLDEFADMVDAVTNLTTAIVLEGGFTATKENDSEHNVPDGTRVVVNVSRGDATGIIYAECPVVAEAVYYHAFISEAPMPNTRIDNSKNLVFGEGEFPLFIDMSKSRKKTFEGLKAGQRYYVYYLIGNARGVSQLTEEKSIMCA